MISVTSRVCQVYSVGCSVTGSSGGGYPSEQVTEQICGSDVSPPIKHIGGLVSHTASPVRAKPNRRPRSLENYFAKQGARLDRRVVGGVELLSLVVSDDRFYPMDGRSCGWSEVELWRAWCRQQRQFAWHEHCVKELVTQGLGQDQAGLTAIHAWIEQVGVWPRENGLTQPWPWSSIGRSDCRSQFMLTGHPWTERARPRIKVDVAALTDVCVVDQFNVDRPDQYIRALGRYFYAAKRDWLESETSLSKVFQSPTRL